MRYQFNPRAHHGAIDLARARKAATSPHITYVRESFPIMGGGKNGPRWRGTNQPRTVSFSAADDAIALVAARAYGQDDAFIWNITENHYV